GAQRCADQGGQGDDRVMARHDALHERAVAGVAADDAEVGVGADAQERGLPEEEAVHHGDLVAPPEQGRHQDRADVAGPAGHQDAHQATSGTASTTSAMTFTSSRLMSGLFGSMKLRSWIASATANGRAPCRSAQKGWRD